MPAVITPLFKTRTGGTTAASHAARRAEVARLMARGLKPEKIVEALGGRIKLATVIRDAVIVRQEWQQTLLQDVGVFQAETIATHRYIIEEALNAWEQSKRDREVKSLRQKTGDGVNGKGSEERTAKVEGRCGDTRYLKVAIEANQEIMKITGGYAPEKRELVDEEGADVLSKLIDRLDEKELQTLDVVFTKYETAQQEQRAEKETEKKALPPPDGAITLEDGGEKQEGNHAR